MWYSKYSFMFEGGCVVAKCALCGGDAGLMAGKYSKDKVWVCWGCASIINTHYKMKELTSMSAEELKEAYDVKANALAAAAQKSDENAIEMMGKLGYAEFPLTKKIGDYLWINENTKQWIAPKDVKSRLGLYRDSTIHSFSEIKDFELLEDGKTITSGGIGSAVVGGLLFGEIGAIVGGITGGKSANEFCTKLQIKITLHDLEHPAEYINLITSSTRRGSWQFNEAFNTAQEILSILQIIRDSEATNAKEPHNSFSVADEIKKFNELLDIGAITQDEYDAKKAELLGISAPTNTSAKEARQQEEARKVADAEKLKLHKAEIAAQEARKESELAEQNRIEAERKAAEAERILQEEARKVAEAEIRLTKEQAQLAKEQRLAKEREKAQRRKEDNKQRAEQAKRRAKDVAQKTGETAVKAGKIGSRIGLMILSVGFFLIAIILAISKFAFQAIDGFGVVIAIVILATIGGLLLKLSKTPKLQ